MKNLMYCGMIVGYSILSSCSGNNENPAQDNREDRIARLERKIDQLMQEQDTEEKIFLRNIRLLKQYVSDHSKDYNIEDAIETAMNEKQPQARYNDFKSWSRRTLDGLSSFFIDSPRGGD